MRRSGFAGTIYPINPNRTEVQGKKAWPSKPVLMVWGEDDVSAIPAEAALALTQHQRLRDRTILAGAGHWVQYEQPEAINTLLASWLQECTPVVAPA